MASRRKGRILAFQALYSWDTGYSQTGDASIPEGLLDFSWTHKNTTVETSEVKSEVSPRETSSEEKMMAFSRLLVCGTIENISDVDKMIQEHLENWELKRLNRVDLAILRMSVYTLMFQDDMPHSVVIDEAVEISKEFGSDDSYRFVNGVLDSVRKTLAHGQTPDGSTASKPAATK